MAAVAIQSKGLVSLKVTVNRYRPWQRHAERNEIYTSGVTAAIRPSMREKQQGQHRTADWEAGPHQARARQLA